MTTPTTPSARTEVFIPWANTAWGFCKCFGMLSSVSATTGRFPYIHGLDVCDVRVEIPFDPTMPWTGVIIGGELNNTIEKMAHIVLTSLCERSLAAIANMPISLFLIHNQEDTMWMQCL
jgi:hypothetical protein